MGTTWIAGVLVVIAFVSWGSPAVAQDKGQTEAAALTSASQAALQTLYGTAELAKVLGPKAQAILVFPKVTKARRSRHSSACPHHQSGLPASHRGNEVSRPGSPA